MFSVVSKDALKSGISDMDYLRSKVAQTEDTGEQSDELNESEDEEEDDGTVQQPDSAYESSERENISKTKPASDKKQSKVKKAAKQEVTFETYLHVSHNNSLVYNHNCLVLLVYTHICLL